MHECDCNLERYGRKEWTELRLHAEVQDTECEAWRRLLSLIDQVAAEGRGELDLRVELGERLYSQIITLPASIAKLKSVWKLNLTSSHLVRLPPEIGDMASLETLELYMSYGLHWLPYEITRCSRLWDSSMSTRALYGNYKYLPPFPQLPEPLVALTPERCSVCSGPFRASGPCQVWISLKVAKDVFPLLVHACSDDCIRRLPQPAEKYIPRPHQGGVGLRPLQLQEAKRSF